jgi:uncharacterized membrane protein YqaE (UPF0057 family)
MLYLLAIICPPLACLFAGRVGSALLNLFLTLLFWIPGVIHAILVVQDAKAEKRNNKLIRAMRDR